MVPSSSVNVISYLYTISILYDNNGASVHTAIKLWLFFIRLQMLLMSDNPNSIMSWSVQQVPLLDLLIEVLCTETILFEF